jgi:hypothetical protein
VKLYLQSLDGTMASPWRPTGLSLETPSVVGPSLSRGRRRVLPSLLEAQPENGVATRTARGGLFAEGVHFRYQGGQVRSWFSLLSLLGTGQYRKRYLGLKAPPTNIQKYHLDTARAFAGGLAKRQPRCVTGEEPRLLVELSHRLLRALHASGVT